MKTQKIVVKPEIITKQIINWKIILLIVGIFFVSILIITKLVSLWRVRLFLNYVQMSQKIYLDPLTLKEKIDQKTKNYILVDIRSQDEYQRGHIKTAVNIPAYKLVDNIEKTRTSANEIINQYKKLNPSNKELIIYGYLPGADIVKEVAILFMERGYFVKMLAVGWQDWRGSYTRWNPAADIMGMDIGQYVEPVSYAPATPMMLGQ